MQEPVIQKQTVTARFEYPVAFTDNVLAPHAPLLANILEAGGQDDAPQSTAVFVDSGVAQAHPGIIDRITTYAAAHADRFELAMPPTVIAGGEAAKNDPEQISAIHVQLRESGLDRRSYVVAIGGGAVLDLVGFAAATFHRGIRHVRIPTTTLAQGDSAVGVKNGVNAFGTKNLLGTFAPPYAVINDKSFLATLSDRQCRSGMSEAVKVALIRDPAFYHWLECHARELDRREPDAVHWAVRRSAELHMEHISATGDPFEQGTARPLDYGHWAAHKLETLTDYELLHGEAVAIGIALDARYAELAGMLSSGICDRICQTLESLGFRLWHPALEKTDDGGALQLLRGLADFREHLGGRLHLIMLEDIGRTVSVHEPDVARIRAAVRWLRGRCENEDQVHPAGFTARL